MTKPLHILILEDHATDADLVTRELQQGGISFTAKRVWTEVDFLAELHNSSLDLILADYSLPAYDGLSALKLAQQERPDLPFIIVSGSVGEEKAIDALHHGTTDYVLKQRLGRLVPAVRRALREVAERNRLKQAQEELRRSEQNYREIFNATHEAIFVLDAVTGAMLDVNQTMLDMYGYARAELLNLTEDQFYGDGSFSREAIQRRVQQASTEGSQVFEWLGKRKNGERFWTEVTLRATEIGGEGRVLAVVRDIAERKQMETQILRHQRLESIGTLAGGVAHDLNNALAPIFLSVNLLRDQVPAKAARFLDIIDSNAKRGADMMRQLLTFARGVEGERVMLLPRDLLQEMEKIITGTFPKNIQFQSHYPRILSAVRGDATQLHQVLLNLCVNARDAMPNGGMLNLEAAEVDIDATFASSVREAKPGRYVLWRVTDNGTGIPPEVLDRVFDPFFTTKDPGKGTGLGLSTVLGIVKSHGGFILVETKVGQGTTFSVYLPAAKSTGAAHQAKDPAEDFHGHGELMLLVEDEPAIRVTLEALLQKLDFKVVTAPDGTDALIKFAERRAEVRVVLCDLQMPHMDGLTLLRALKRMAPELPAIIITGNLSGQQTEELKSLGIDAILKKPFTQDKLVEMLKQALQPARKQKMSQVVGE